MGFKSDEVSKLLVECHRRCCICHRFCGVKIEIDHIDQRADSKDDSIENAIPVCFECHAEIHLYNPHHPKGRKFQPEEIRAHKKQWMEVCKKMPAIFVQPLQRSDIGPLHALIDELKFNKGIKENNNVNENGCRFETKQFDRVLAEGYLSILHDDLVTCLIETYRKMKAANTTLDALVRASCDRHYNEWGNRLIRAINAVDTLDNCYGLLDQYLK